MLRTGFHDPQLLRETVEPIPLKRLAQPEEVSIVNISFGSYKVLMDLIVGECYCLSL